MPKIIQTLCEVVPEEGLLIRSSYLRNNIKATKLVNEAQRRAKALVLDAQAQAESIFLAAKVQGYSAGICAAATHLVQYLNEHEERTVQIQEKLQEHTRHLLKHCVTNPEVVISTLEQCLSEQTPQVSARLDLVLPEYFRLHHRSLMERISKIHHGQIKVEFWPEGRFLLRLGDCVAEFVPDDFVMQSSQEIMNELSCIYTQYRSVAEKCQQQLAEIFKPVGDIKNDLPDLH